MKLPGRTWRGIVVLGVALASSLALPAKAAEPRWPEGAYTYFVLDQDLRAVLEQFGRHISVPLRVSGDITSTRLKGKLGAPSSKAFLQWVCDSFRLVWYFDGVTLHVAPQGDQQNAYLDLGSIPQSTFKQRVEAAGIAEERFPILPTADPQFVSVVGPALYTARLREALASMRDAPVAAVTEMQLSTPPATPPLAHAVEVPVTAERDGATPVVQMGKPSAKQPRRIASPRYMQGGGERANAKAAGATAAAAPSAAPVGRPQTPPTRGVANPQASQAATPASGIPTAVQNNGIDVRHLSADEKKRLARELIYEDEAAERLQTGKVLIFRGGY